MDEDFNLDDLKDEPKEERKHAQIDFFVHENDMMQKDIDNERMHDTHRKTVRDICITFILLIVIFVVTYTVRTNIFLGTINRMNDAILEMATLHHQCVEVNDAKEETVP